MNKSDEDELDLESNKDEEASDDHEILSSSLLPFDDDGDSSFDFLQSILPSCCALLWIWKLLEALLE